MLAASLALVLSAAGPAPARPAPGDPPAALLRALREAPAGGARAAAATRPLVGRPYLASALGEGAGPDPDPRFRLDAFDCLGFVETAVALGSADSLAQAAAALDDVRYAGAPVLAGRNHEVLSQWIPRNLEKGWIEDLGVELAGARARHAAKEYTAASWAAVRRAGRSIAGLPRSGLPLGRFEVALVPASEVGAVAARIPDGAIAFLVREDRPDRATRITHAALVVAGADGARRARHATSSAGVARVIEEPLERFLARESSAYPRWPVEGLAIFAVRDNRAHLARLPALARPPGAPPGARPPADAAHGRM